MYFQKANTSTIKISLQMCGYNMKCHDTEYEHNYKSHNAVNPTHLRSKDFLCPKRLQTQAGTATLQRQFDIQEFWEAKVNWKAEEVEFLIFFFKFPTVKE